MEGPCFSIDGTTVAYGGLHALVDVSLRVAAGRVRRHRRTERRGQDDAVQDHFGHGASRLPAGSCSTAAICSRCRRRERAASRHRARAGGTAGLPLAVACSRISKWAPYPARPRGLARNLEHIFCAVPGAGRAARPAGGDAVGRRAADARDRPRARLLAPTAAARRAVDGAGADASPTDLRPHRGDPSRDAAHHPAGRAARGRGARVAATAATCSRPAGSCFEGTHDALIGGRARANGRISGCNALERSHGHEARSCDAKRSERSMRGARRGACGGAWRSRSARRRRSRRRRSRSA